MKLRLNIDEEGRRSIRQRGVLGHYIAGIYRTVARPLATHRLILWAKMLEFLWGMEEVAFFIQRQPIRYMIPLLQAFGATVADDAIVGHDLMLIGVNRARFAPLKIGRQVFIARRVIIDLAADVSFGDCSTVSYDTQFLCHIDVAHSPLKSHEVPVNIQPIKVGRGAFIAAGVIVTGGAVIGECSLIGANSVVIGNIPPYTFAAGTPAKVIREFERSKVPAFNPDEAFIVPEGTTP
jgi:acetyltransferase-like isoleucine patch superfamily enzyme